MDNIHLKETLTIEFKSDLKRLPDSDIVEAVVAFANTDGGDFYLGVEDNGDITGLHSSHKNTDTLAAFIANKTIPPVSVRIEKLDFNHIQVLKISVPRHKNIVATSSGKLVRRRIKMDGTPENVPMYPYEFASRLSDLSLLDYSAQPVPDSSYEDLDPLERERLRNIIRTYHGESMLLQLTDEELDKALRFITVIDGKTHPTLTGLLVIGKKERLQTLVPTAEAAIQVMDGTTLRVNESFTLPLLAAIEKITDYFNAWNTEEEMEVGMFRISIPHYDKRAFREALVNAFCHRDYSMLGRVRVLIDNEGLTIANPGGFIDGIDYRNLIDVEPHGRNPVLADCLKRIGLAERSGRGIDRIYEGTLRYGRGLPDYSQSTTVMVKLFMPNVMPDKSFIAMLTEEQKINSNNLSIYALMILNCLRQQHRVQLKELSEILHLDNNKIKVALETLVEEGVVEAVGNGNNRSYILSAKIYRTTGKLSAYVRQTDIDEIRYTELVLKLLKEQKAISRKDVADLLHISLPAAYRILQKLRKEDIIEMVSKGRGAKYIMKNRAGNKAGNNV